jgi:hypothetical protein
MFMKSYADELELLDREHRHKIKKMETAFSRQLQYIMERLKVQQVKFLSVEMHLSRKLRSNSNLILTYLIGHCQF